mmetsp:Transcript_134826/g.336402  ORF Transcript_134826/g.336402 Transcript_134826/m.336402 type:complete len:446 (-) Transcript_134826:192-1529(-)
MSSVNLAAAVALVVFTVNAVSHGAAFCETRSRAPNSKVTSHHVAATPLKEGRFGAMAALQDGLEQTQGQLHAQSANSEWALGSLCAAGLAGLWCAAARGSAAVRYQRGTRGAVSLRASFGMRIVGTGSGAPEMVVSNDDLSEIVETSDEWISQRTGIRSRHILKPDETLASVSVTAAQKALDNAGVSADEVDLVILATSTPDDLFGSATAVAEGVGAQNAVAFDLTAACSGFVFALVTASQYLRSGGSKTALVVGADCLSRWLDWSDRNTCVLFGDGAGAVVLKATEPEHDSLIGYEMGSDGKGRCSLWLSSDSEAVNLGGGKSGAIGKYGYLGMNGKDVFRFATSRVPAVLGRLLEKHKVAPEEVDWLLLHQANRRIMDSAAKKLKLPLDKVLCNLDEYGNTSAASIPLALDEAMRDGRVKKGQLVACMGFGAGLSWGGALIRV